MNFKMCHPLSQESSVCSVGSLQNSSVWLALGVIEGSMDFNAVVLLAHKRLMFCQP